MNALNSAIMQFLKPLLSRIRAGVMLVAVGALLLNGCSTVPNSEASGPAKPDTGASTEEPELTLNLPEQGESDCVVEPVHDHTFLEKGIDALASGDHIEAVTYFQRYQRLEPSDITDWEVEMAIAFASMMPQSPFYDVRAAGKSYRELQAREVDESQVHASVLVMRDALATLSAQQLQIGKLNGEKAQLLEDLAKREEALKRLRELTLGQKAATP